MEENLINFEQNQPTQPTEPAIPAIEKTGAAQKINGKTKDFLIGLFFGLGGAIVLALLDLLCIALANPERDAILSFFVFFGPLLILSLYIFFLIYFFKRRKQIFWGLSASLFVFIILVVVVAIVT